MSTSNINPHGFDIAILFWFYKELDVTRNHLELIRKHNPTLKIYGLFGGDISEAPEYERTLSPLLDDFWAYTGTYGSDMKTKWIHGDLLLLDWYDKCGRKLSWDSIAIIQWDMLLFNDIKSLVPGIKKGQVFFSGYRELDSTLEEIWMWTKLNGKHRKDYEDFSRYVERQYNYRHELKCCLYIFEILTRSFFEAYLKVPNKKVGMLEYKNPTLAFIWGLSIYERDIGVYWKDQSCFLEPAPLNPMAVEVDESYIKQELRKAHGWRLFHPYERLWPLKP